MSNILRQAVENRRRELMNILITFGVLQKEDKQINELSLTDLEKEYINFILNEHPHSEIGSIRWGNKDYK